MTTDGLEGPDFGYHYTEALEKVIEAKREDRSLPEPPHPTPPSRGGVRWSGRSIREITACPAGPSPLAHVAPEGCGCCCATVLRLMLHQRLRDPER